MFGTDCFWGTFSFKSNKFELVIAGLSEHSFDQANLNSDWSKRRG